MVEIVTERLVVRPVQAGDAEFLAVLSSDFDLARMTVRIPFPNPVADVRVWMQSAASNGEAIFVPTLAGEIIGAGSYFPAPTTTSDGVGYWLAKPHWGKGYATEMVRALIRHAFLSPDLVAALTYRLTRADAMAQPWYRTP